MAPNPMLLDFRLTWKFGISEFSDEVGLLLHPYSFPLFTHRCTVDPLIVGLVNFQVLIPILIPILDRLKRTYGRSLTNVMSGL